MDIVKNEICKLLTKRTVLILLFLLVLNPVLGLYTMNTVNDDGYTDKDYSALYGEISNYSREDVLPEIEQRQMTAEAYGRISLCSRVYKEALACLSYDEYLDSVNEKADEISIMNKFSGNGGFAEKNAAKTSRVYSKLEGTVPEVMDASGLLNITDNELTDYVAVIMLFIIALNLVFYEKSENQLALLRTTARGRRQLMASKSFVMIMAVILITLLLYGINAVISMCFYNPINLKSPLQSVYLYYGSPFKLSIGQFLACYFPVKIISFILLGMFFMLICAALDNIIFVFVASAVTVVIEAICYTTISGTSFLAFLKYINIMYGVRTGRLFSDYVNINLFGYPLNTGVLYGLFWLVCIAVCIFAVTNYLNSVHEKKLLLLPGFACSKNTGCHTSLFLHECYKALVPGKVLLILIAAALFVVWWNPAEKLSYDSVDEVYYKEYMDKYYGPLTAKTNELLDEERAKYDRLSDNIAYDMEQGKSESYINIKYKDELSRQEAFNKLTAHVDYLKTLNEGWLFFEKGYDILTDRTDFKNRDTAQAFVYVILLIAIACGICGADYANHEIRLLRTTRRGRKQHMGIKCILGFLGAVTAFALVYIVRLCNVLLAYGTQGLNAPAASMEHLWRVSQNISVGQYILIIMLMRFIGGLLVSLFVFAMFKYLRSGMSVIISCVLFIVLPLALVAFGVTNAQYFLFNPLLLGNIF